MIETTGRLAHADDSLREEGLSAATRPLDAPLRQRALRAMSLALRTNRGVVDELSKCYAAFRFIGGPVSGRRWDLVALGRYLEQPFVVGRIVTADAQRYRQLAVEIMTLGKTISESGPKALRRRFVFADRFDAMSAEIRSLAAKLEIALTQAIEETTPASPAMEDGRALEPVEWTAKPLDGIEETRGGDS